MGFEKSHLFGKVEIDIRATVAGTIVFQTETPGSALSNRYILQIPVCTRTVLRSRLPGTMQGHYVRCTGIPSTTAPSGIWELYGVRIWQRQLPDGQWEWFPMPVMDTPVEYTAFKIPGLGEGSEATAATYSEFKIPVEETSASYTPQKVPLIATPEDFAEFKVPVEPTGDFTQLKVPLMDTPAEWTRYKLPVKLTPAVPEWVAIPVDE